MGEAGTSKPLPLAGIRILDLTRVLSGPYCALILGELGAEVIKIEKPGRGDHARRPRGGPGDTGLRFLAWNLNRKSVTLDTWQDEGREVFKDLVRRSDVVLENFRPGVMAAMGLGFNTLREVKSDIILTSISGWGQGNTLSNYTAHNSVITAFTGLMHMNRFEDGPPMPPPGSSADCGGGVYAAIGTLAAIIGRNATGMGRHVDISMADAVIGQTAFDLLYVLLTGENPRERDLRAGDGVTLPAFHEVYEAKDGWVYVQADLAEQWKRLAEGIGRPELITDPRFMTERARGDNKEELDAILKEWLKGKTKDEAFAILGGAGVPCSPAYSVFDVAHHPYLRERGILQDIDDPRLGKTPAISGRIQFVGEKPRKPRYAPLLGEHNEEVFQGLLGYDKDKIEALQRKGVI